MFFALLAKGAWLLSGKLKNLAVNLQGRCSHPKLWYVADNWDYEYGCRYCDKRWVNQVPSLSREFESNGKRFRIEPQNGDYIREVA